jgi:hypothetical protein
MSKTDQMRALREARFTRTNSAPSRRASSAAATVAPLARSARLASPVETLPPAFEVAVESDVAEVAIVEADVVEAGVAKAHVAEVAVPLAAVAEAPPAVPAAFEVPTLDIPFPAAVPKVRETPNPAASAKSSEPAGPPASEQIVIPALDLTAISLQSPAEVAAPLEQIEAPDPIAFTQHGVGPGQPIAAYTPEDLAAVVRWVNRDTPLPDAAAIVSAVMAELGFKRKGKKITDAITSAAVSIGALTDESVAFVPDANTIAS